LLIIMQIGNFFQFSLSSHQWHSKECKIYFVTALVKKIAVSKE
jgi:hypothetical protein